MCCLVCSYSWMIQYQFVNGGARSRCFLDNCLCVCVCVSKCSHLFGKPQISGLIVAMLRRHLCRTQRTKLTVLGRELNMGRQRMMGRQHLFIQSNQKKFRRRKDKCDLVEFGQTSQSLAVENMIWVQ